jgi:hypothetical protein
MLVGLLALVRGLLYVALIPPWQGPDEAGHFESVRLFAELGRIPGRADVSPTLEREIVDSMARYRA